MRKNTRFEFQDESPVVIEGKPVRHLSSWAECAILWLMIITAVALWK